MSSHICASQKHRLKVPIVSTKTKTVEIMKWNFIYNLFTSSDKLCSALTVASGCRELLIANSPGSLKNVGCMPNAIVLSESFRST